MCPPLTASVRSQVRTGKVEWRGSPDFIGLPYMPPERPSERPIGDNGSGPHGVCTPVPRGLVLYPDTHHASEKYTPITAAMPVSCGEHRRDRAADIRQL